MSRRVKVPAEGPAKAQIAVVGESPGAMEVSLRRPFVGSSGKLLDAALKQSGLQRSELLISNACKYRPTGDKDRFFFAEKPKRDDPESWIPTDLFREGIEELHRELADREVRVVLALGNFALWALCRKWGIQKWWLSVLEPVEPWGPGARVVPTVHPAAIQRQFVLLPFLGWAVDRVAEEAQVAEIVRPKRSLNLDPSPAIYPVLAREWRQAEILAVDTEWFTPNELACVGFSASPGEAWVIPVERPGAIELFREALGGPARKVFQNAAFDITCLRRLGIEVRGPIEDTMVAHHCVWPGLPKDLGTLTAIYTREPWYKDDLKVWGRVGDRAILWNYNAKDAACTFEVWTKVEPDLDRSGTRWGYETSMAMMEPMLQATEAGIRVDRDIMAELRAGYLREAEEGEAKLAEIAGRPVNPRSSKDVAKLLYQEMGLRARTRGGQVTTAEHALMDLAATLPDGPKKEAATLVARIRHARKLVSSYLDPRFVDPDGRMRCVWNVAGTVTGRLSASRTFWGSGVSLQTIPKKRGPEIRRMFVADPGHRFVMWDLEQAEARVVAYLAKDEQTIEWMVEGLDLHRVVASLLFGIPYEEMLRRPKGCRERYLAKVCNHALAYMMGPGQLKNTINREYVDTGIGVTAKEAVTLRARYLQVRSALPAWWEDVRRQIEGRHELHNLLGRKGRFIGRSYDVWKSAVGYVPQSTVGDMTNLAVRRLWEAGRDRGLVVLAHMHDGALVQVPEDETEWALQAAKEAATIPLRAGGWEFVVPVEVSHSDRWS